MRSSHASMVATTSAIVGPRLVGEDNRVEVSFGPMIAPFAELRQKMLVKGHDLGIGVISAYVNRLTQRSREVDWVSGACLLVRRADAEAVGLFDERYLHVHGGRRLLRGRQVQGAQSPL